MKICFPVKYELALSSTINPHFGSAPYYFIYDTEAKTQKVIDNGNKVHEHGQCNPIGIMIENRVQAVACAGMGARAIMLLQQNNIKVYYIPIEYTVGEIINNLDNIELQEMSIENACGQHKC